MESLKKVREERGLSQVDLAASLDVKQPFIVQLEKGIRRIPEPLLRPLAKKLRVKPAELRSWSRFAHLKFLLDEEKRKDHDVDYLIETKEGRNYITRLFKLVIEIIDSGEALVDVDLHEAVMEAANEIARQEGYELS